MTEKVRNFIEENLHLRTEAPGLELKDYSNLLGGMSNGKNVFFEQTALTNKGLGVVVGLDSMPVLSFTSGSEGRPKSVRGRHYSLAFYFDWMAKCFHPAKDDKFSLLGGIAHDFRYSVTFHASVSRSPTVRAIQG